LNLVEQKLNNKAHQQQDHSMLRKYAKIICFSIIALTCVSFATPALAQGYGLKAAAGEAGIYNEKGGNDNLAELVGNVLGTVLSLVSVLFFGLIIYGGFMWMTARGNADQEKNARNAIFGAIAGLIIVLSAYAITRFIFQAVGGNIPTSSSSSSGLNTPASSNGFAVADTCSNHYPAFSCGDKSLCDPAFSAGDYKLAKDTVGKGDHKTSAKYLSNLCLSKKSDANYVCCKLSAEAEKKQEGNIWCYTIFGDGKSGCASTTKKICGSTGGNVESSKASCEKKRDVYNFNCLYWSAEFNEYQCDDVWDKPSVCQSLYKGTMTAGGIDGCKKEAANKIVGCYGKDANTGLEGCDEIPQNLCTNPLKPFKTLSDCKASF
jgi:hypothetical protein